jgi:hypothetical protein
MLALQPPTREEVARTVWIGGLTEDAPNDDQLEAILRCAGKLRRWTRARDADDKKCKFGFAEYEDVESLEAASEIYGDIEVPAFNADGTLQREDESEEEYKKIKLQLQVDEASKKYIEEWKGRGKEDDDARQFRIDSCKEDLRSVIAGLANGAAVNGANGHANGDGDVTMGGMKKDDNDGAEVINIPASTLEDDLADIPAEMRATVAEEIKNFRDRSNRRDIERLRREEELEQNERNRSNAAARINRLASPPPGANGIPVGPRGTQGVQGAPSGPKGFRGAQIPSDYVNGVVFVPGVGPNGAGTTVSINREDDDAEESDEELERKREAKKEAELDALYNERVRRWEGKERARRNAAERERKREEEERRGFAKAKEDMLARLANWKEEEHTRDLYYKERSLWLRQRESAREAERREDDADRRAEAREEADQRRREAEAQGQANSFLDSMGSEPVSKTSQEQAPAAGFGGLKFSLGSAAAAKTKQQQAPAKRALADIEGLLEDEEDAAAAGSRRLELKTLQDTSTVPISGADLTEQEKGEARQQLATEIPTDSTALYAHPIKWKSLTLDLVNEQIRPFLEKKILDYLGVQEDFLVDEIVQGILSQKKPDVMEEELSLPLEDEAGVLVKKLWRLLVFWGECASRGL